MFSLDTHPPGHEAVGSGWGSGGGGGLRSVLQIVPALNTVQFFTSHLPRGRAVEMTTHPPLCSEKQREINVLKKMKYCFIRCIYNFFFIIWWIWMYLRGSIWPQFVYATSVDDPFSLSHWYSPVFLMSCRPIQKYWGSLLMCSLSNRLMKACSNLQIQRNCVWFYVGKYWNISSENQHYSRAV